MIVYAKRINKQQGCQGRGLINKLINKLPVELHIPGYQYCGPGTKLAKRLARGDPGINPLDVACKDHDIAYSQNRENIEARNVADRVLADRAWQRVISKDSSISEKAAAYGVTNAMKLKSKFGMGVKRKLGKGVKRRKRQTRLKTTTLNKIVKSASKRRFRGKCALDVIKSASSCARTSVKKAGSKKNIRFP